jgi:uncharacterized protein YegP (UPF0339 family)
MSLASFFISRRVLSSFASAKKNAGNDAHYERKDTKNGHFMFNLKATSHQVIGTSQSYKTAESRDEGIASVKTNGLSAPVDDEA